MKCAIFDLDGTLLYTLKDLQISTNFVLEKYGYKKRELNEIRKFVGNGIKKLIERASEEKDEKKLKILLDEFLIYYQKNSDKNTGAFEGILEVLEKLKEKNIKIAVNTNKADICAKKLCEKFFPNLIDLCVGETKNNPKKPNPAGVLEITKKTSAREVIYIGDSLVDIQTAKNAQIPCISVLWGYCDKEFLLKENKNCANTAQELLDKIFQEFKIM